MLTKHHLNTTLPWSFCPKPMTQWTAGLFWTWSSLRKLDNLVCFTILALGVYTSFSKLINKFGFFQYTFEHLCNSYSHWLHLILHKSLNISRFVSSFPLLSLSLEIVPLSLRQQMAIIRKTKAEQAALDAEKKR